MMTKEEYKDMLTAALMNDGLHFCLNALQEECAETIIAINHLRRKRCDVNHVIGEMADVKLMIDMCRLGLDGKMFFDDCINKKAEAIGKKIKWRGGDKK